MAIRVACAPVSWGIYEFEGMEPKYPYQQVLDEIKEVGYTGIELGPWQYLPTDPAVLRAELDQRGLQLLSAFVPVKLVDAVAHQSGLDHARQVGQLLKALGAQYIVLADDNGTVPELVKSAGRRSGSQLSGAEWDTYAKGVNFIAQNLYDELGLKITFHHHGAGYVETPDEVAALMERTDPDLVGICLDTGHWHLGGGDAVECIRQYGKRVNYLHLKDFSAETFKQCQLDDQCDYFQAIKAGIFCELGKGVVDFPGVLKAMEQNGYDGWAIVEQDVLSDDPDYPLAAATRNRTYLKSLGI